MSDIRNWSTTPASNTDSSNGGMPEGMAPSAVNDNVRTQMAAHRTQWEDAEWFDWGHLVQVTSNTEFTVSNSVTDIYTLGRRLKFINGATTLRGHVISVSAVSGTNTKFTVSLGAGTLTSTISAVSVAILDPAYPSIPKGYAIDTPSIASGTISGTTIIAPTMAGTVLTSVTGTVAGAAIEFTSIPSWVKRITIQFSGLSSSGTSPLLVQLGDSGGYETSGYSGTVTQALNAVSGVALSAGFALSETWSGTSTLSGIVTISQITSTTWACSVCCATGGGGATLAAAGSKTLDTALTQLRIIATNTTDTFDAGAVNILYE